MKKASNIKQVFFVTLLVMIMSSGSVFAASASAKQLERGKQLYAQQRNDEAMDAFIDVLVNGSRAEVEEANKYVNLIHSRIGGIQNPVEVDADFQEGKTRHLSSSSKSNVYEEQLAAETDPIEKELQDAGLTVTAEADATAIRAQQEAEWAAEKAEERTQDFEDQFDEEREQAYQEALEVKEEALIAKETVRQRDSDEKEDWHEDTSSTFDELADDPAVQARQIYTSQKLLSMREAAIAKLRKEKGVRLYFRNGQPDAIDIDSEILFDGYKFRTEALPLLDEVYALMALTQGAGYTILPPGSYTDNITLAGIRQAMALNSYFVHKGLSSGKISYNMGLFDQEPPAKYANLDGVSIVFDFDAVLPASLPEATSVSSLPLLSMAVVPVDNKINPANGEAFAIDFSVIETANPIDNWVFQIVQHAGNDTYYVVRQLEGFSAVYHQLVWNGRKGMIGTQLPCGDYTLALTAKDVQGGERTLRRQVSLSCSSQKASQKNAKSTATTNLNYKSARLWKKPGRVMKNTVAAEQPVVSTEPEVVDPFATDEALLSTSDTPADSLAVPAQPQGVSNPYDMPYEQYGN